MVTRGIFFIALLVVVNLFGAFFSLYVYLSLVFMYNMMVICLLS